ncbi:MAG: hypothetical protein LBT26_08200, partial [Clostridiales Family XIII bacterium]|nr:hypothetical protein [Clostridiales Family XIII bacterium]
MTNTIFFFGQQLLLCFVPLMIVALAGIYSERSGIMNFSLEGLMLAGAFAGAFFLRGMQEILPGNVAFLLALFIAGLAGSAVMMLHSYASISLGGTQIISGMAVNLLMPALTIVLARAIIGVLQSPTTPSRGGLPWPYKGLLLPAPKRRGSESQYLCRPPLKG